MKLVSRTFLRRAFGRRLAVRLLQFRLPSLNETQRFLLLSMLIGSFSGLVVVCFHIAIETANWRLLGVFGESSWYSRVITPAFGAFAAFLLVKHVFPRARGSGVNYTKAALYVSDGHVPFSTVVGKFTACSLSIGSGNPLGPEDPALQMGSGIASLFGRLFKLRREISRLIAPVGAAAGIAAAFNTPITAVLFVIEEVLAGWNAGVLGSIVLSAVSAVVVSRLFLGNEPLFSVPEFQLTHPSELLVYAVIGVVGGLLSVLFVRLISYIHHVQPALPTSVLRYRPLLAGLIVGFAGLLVPEVLGAGYETIDSALHEQFLWGELLSMASVKMLLTLICFSAGVPGGMFAPTLFTGAMAGGGIGALASQFWPFPTSSPSAYVLVGMGTYFAGVFRAPMTSIFMVFEVSANYVIILPVMIANTVAYLISRQLQPRPFFAVIAEQEGMNLPSVEQQRESSVLIVENAMNRDVPPVIRYDRSVRSVYEQIARDDHRDYLVGLPDDKWAYLRQEQVEGLVQAGKSEQTLSNALVLPPLPPVYRDYSLDTAMRLLARHPLLVVPSRADSRQLLGVLTLADVHRAYGIPADGAGRDGDPLAPVTSAE
jgi:chloride channel protein, CIC family